MKVKAFIVDKKCGCGIKYTSLPENAKYHDSGDIFEGWYFTCPEPCGSTHWVRVTKAEIEILDDKGKL